MTEEFPPHGEPAVPFDVGSGDVLGPSIDSPELSAAVAVEPSAMEPAQAGQLLTADQNQGCWYYGVGEAIAWFIGSLGVHLFGGLLAFVLTIFGFYLLSGKPPSKIDSPEVMMPVCAGEMTIFVLASMLAVSLRFWGTTFQELNMSLPDPRHVMIVALGTVPVSLCVAAWSLPIQWAWSSLQEMQPMLKVFDEMNTMEVVKEMGQSTPFLVMVFVIAVLPAVGEELVFRGAIGRVLIANMGLWGGLILTSILFGLLHIHPVHALSVIPFGLLIHLLYLATRSFWMPMLLHFLNNTWAILASGTKFEDPTDHVGHISVFEGFELVLGGVTVLLLGFALWQSRVRLIQPDGKEWISARFPLHVPPSSEIQRKSAHINIVCWGTAIVCALVCHVMVGIGVWASVADAV